MATPLIILHAGAGYHPESSVKLLTGLCENSCLQAIQILQDGGSSQEAVTCAISILEDTPFTNCGCGSNLTLHGEVECDASMMCGRSGCYGSAGAVTEIKNPIKVASRLLSQQRSGLMSLGRIPPIMLVGAGAKSYAMQQGMEVCSADELITDRTRAVYIDHMNRLERVEGSDVPPAKKAHIDEPVSPLLIASRQIAGAQDTVGAVAMDTHGTLCAGVSSGGLSLKLPGRVGHAAMFGCGCWAQNIKGNKDLTGFACSASGAGEHIAKTLLAKECYSYFQSRADSPLILHNFLQEHFLSHPFLCNTVEKNCGLIVLQSFKGGCELSWGHTTDSFCVAYQGVNEKPKVIFSRLDTPTMAGKTIKIGGVYFNNKDGK